MSLHVNTEEASKFSLNTHRKKVGKPECGKGSLLNAEQEINYHKFLMLRF